jgi:ligand-binding sensor domain-containing protein
MLQALLAIILRISSLVSCIMFLSIKLSLALNPETAITQYGVGSWQANEGLKHSTITSIVQTSDGYLWLGTPGGLIKFNGEVFTSIEHDNLNESIWNLMVSKDGGLWVCTNGKGLIKIKDGKFTTYTTQDGLSTNKIRAVYETSDGTIWIGTHNGGINILKDGKITHVEDNLSKETITTIYEDRQGVLWFGARNGLFSFKDGSFNRYPLFRDGDKVTQILEDRNGKLWISLGTGLSIFHNNRLNLYLNEKQERIKDAYTMCEDRDGNLWVGTASTKFYRINNNKITVAIDLNELINPQINKIKVVMKIERATYGLEQKVGDYASLRIRNILPILLKKDCQEDLSLAYTKIVIKNCGLVPEMDYISIRRINLPISILLIHHLKAHIHIEHFQYMVIREEVFGLDIIMVM